MNPIDKKLLAITNLLDGFLPNGVMAIIAKQCKVSGERVRQRAEAIGLVTPQKRKDVLFKCVVCGKMDVQRNEDQKTCSITCTRIRTKEKYFIYKTCCICGKVKNIYRSKFDPTKPFYCSKVCYGVSFGRINGRSRKYPQTKEEFLAKVGSETFTSRMVSESFGITFASAIGLMWQMKNKHIIHAVGRKEGSGKSFIYAFTENAVL